MASKQLLSFVKELRSVTRITNKRLITVKVTNAVWYASCSLVQIFEPDANEVQKLYTVLLSQTCNPCSGVWTEEVWKKKKETCPWLDLDVKLCVQT